VSILAGAPAHAERPVAGHISDFQVDDQDPESSIPDPSEFKKDPLNFGYLIMDLADRADFAIKKSKDYASAIKYYKALIKVVPDRAIGYAKVCEVYEMAGDRASAIPWCRTALVKDGARPEEYERFVGLLLRGGGPSEVEQKEVEAVIEGLRRSKVNAGSAADIECRLAVRLSDVGRLERCTKELATLAPQETNNIGYQWSLAILKRDQAGARQLIEKARQAGLEVDGLERMTRASQRATLKRNLSFALAAVLLLAGGALVVLRRRELVAAVGRGAARGAS
jgi:hypothetical protein